MKVLVTGANGFIGRNLVQKLEEASIEVRAFIQSGTDRSPLGGLKCEIAEGDILDLRSLEAAARGTQVVFHLAAKVSDWGRWDEFRKVNIEGVSNVLRASVAGGVKRLVHMSSLAVHGLKGYVDAKENAPLEGNESNYSKSKAEAERFLEASPLSKRIETVIIRPGALILGPWDRLALPGMATALKSRMLAYVAKGERFVCFSYSENLAEGLVLAGTIPAAKGQTYVLADKGKHTWRQVVEGIAMRLSLPLPFLSFPPLLAIIIGRMLGFIYEAVGSKNPPPVTHYRAALVSRDFHFVSDKAKAELGFNPRVDFETALDRSIAWYKANY